MLPAKEPLPQAPAIGPQRGTVQGLKRLTNGHDPELPATALDYAQRGVVQAQMAIGNLYCDPDRYSRTEHGMDAAGALKWLQRAAASGNPYAMDELANCQRRIINAGGTTPAYPPDASSWERFISKIPRTDFRWDEQVYWFWRAAKAFDEGALAALNEELAKYDLHVEPPREPRWTVREDWSLQTAREQLAAGAR